MKTTTIIFALILFASCGNQPSQATLKLQHEADSLKAYGEIFTKYETFILQLEGAGRTEKEATEQADSTFKQQRPVKNAPWDK